MVLLVLMVLVMAPLHPLHGLLLQKVHAVNHPQHVPPGLDGGENGIHPGVGLAAQVNKEVAALDPEDVRRGGLVGMALRPGGQQQRHVRQLPGGGAGEVIGREDGGDDLRPFRILRRQVRAAGGQKQQGAEGGENSFHGRSPFPFSSFSMILQGRGKCKAGKFYVKDP